jgi:hypothetical protein
VVFDVFMEVFPVRTGVHQTGKFAVRYLIVFVSPAPVKNDHEGSAPRVIIRGVQIRRIQKHNVSFFGAGRPPCPNSRRHTPGGAVVADNSFADDEESADRPPLPESSMRHCSAVMTQPNPVFASFRQADDANLRRPDGRTTQAGVRFAPWRQCVDVIFGAFYAFGPAKRRTA